MNSFYILLSFFFCFKKKKFAAGLFLCCLVFAVGIHVPVGLNCEQMEPPHEEQYSQERNPRAYVSMRDYRNLPWQQPVERNQNPCRSMRDYRDPWMSAPIYGFPLTYAPPASPHFTSTPQPPQLISPIEQAILNLSKLVDNFKEEQRAVDIQANQENDIVESSLNKELDEFQSEIDENCDILQQFQEELMQEPVEAPEELLVEEAGGGRGKEVGEEPQKLIPQPNPINLNPNATAQPRNSPLPVYILPVAQFIPEAPTTKASLALPALKSLKKLVATVRASTTTSKTQAAAYIAWHSGWFWCWFGFGAPEPRHF